MNIKTETVYRRTARLSDIDEEFRLDYVAHLKPGDLVGVYDVYFGDISNPNFYGNDVVEKITSAGIIKLKNTKASFDRAGLGRGRSKPKIGNSGLMIWRPK